jgi:hypothetical protein
MQMQQSWDPTTFIVVADTLSFVFCDVREFFQASPDWRGRQRETRRRAGAVPGAGRA